MQTACTILYCYLWSVRLYHVFPHYIIEGRMRVLNFSIILSEIILVLRRTDRNIIINIYGFYVKYPLFLSYFND
jgi:hypothetical protein